jgi:hypothetical protein
MNAFCISPENTPPGGEAAASRIPFAVRAAGKDAKTTRDILQLGSGPQFGTGMIPADLILGTTPKPGIPEGVESICLWSRKSVTTSRMPTGTRNRSSGPPQRIQSSRKSNDYANVFTGQHTRKAGRKCIFARELRAEHSYAIAQCRAVRSVASNRCA